MEHPYKIKTRKSRCALSTDSKPKQKLGHLGHFPKMFGLFYRITTPPQKVILLVPFQ